MVTVNFNKEESDQRTESGWNWFYGTVKAVDRELEYEFSLCEMNTKVGGQNTTAIEITWVNDTPEGSSEIETQIERKFEEVFPC